MFRRPLLEVLRDVTFFELTCIEHLLTGPELRFLRRRVSITQEEMATLLGVDRGTVIQYERKPVLDPQTSLAVQKLMERHVAGLVTKWPDDLRARNAAALARICDVLAVRVEGVHEYHLADNATVRFEPCSPS